MDENSIDETIRDATQAFINMTKAAKEKDIDKAAIVFYGIIKRTYAAAREEDLFEKDKDEIILALKGTQLMMMLMLASEGWDADMVEEFDDKVKKLWNVDGDEEC